MSRDSGRRLPGSGGSAVQLSDVTGLGRTLEWSIPSNRTAILGGFLAAIAIGLRDWHGFDPAALWEAGSTGLAVFLSWALARELDPDDPGPATLAMLFCLGLAFTAGADAFGAAIALVALRLMVGSVGRPLRIGDHLVLVAAATVAGLRPGLWPVGALVILALVVARPRGYGLSAIASSIALGIATLAGAGFAWVGSLGSIAVAGVGVLAGLAALPVADVSTRTDRGDRLISTGRVIIARLAATGVIVSTSFLSTDPSSSVGPVLAALGAIALFNTLGKRTVPPAGSTDVGHDDSLQSVVR